MQVELKPFNEGTLLPVKASPGSRRNEIRGAIGGQLKVCVTQVAEKGKANTAIISLLAKALDIPRRQIQLQSGTTSSEKIFLISGIELSALARKIQSATAENNGCPSPAATASDPPKGG